MPRDPSIQFRTGPSTGIEKGTAGIDREKKAIYGVSVLSEGAAQGHNLTIDEKTIDQVIEASKAYPRGVKSRFGHPNMSSSAEGRYLGRMVNFRKADEGGKKRARADLFLSDVAFSEPANNVGEYVMDLAEEDPDAFGTSIVFDRAKDELIANEDGSRKRDPMTGEDLAPLVRIAKLRGADVVDDPATGDGLFSRTTLLSATFTEQLDALLAESDAADTVQAYLRRYAASRNIDPETLRENVSQLFATKQTPPSAPSPGDATAAAAQEPTPTEEVRGMAGTQESGSPAAGAPNTDALAVAHKREVEDAKAEAAKLAREAEQNRVVTIQRLGVKLGIEDQTVQEAVAGNVSIEEATKRFTAIETAGLKAVRPSIVVGKDESDKFAAGAEAAFAMQLGYADKKTAEDVRKSQLTGLSLTGLARRCLELSGEGGMSTVSNVDAVDRMLSLARRTQFGPGMQATPDFTSILSNVANKAMATGWELAATTYQVWCGRGNLADYKQADLVKGSEFSDDMLIPEGEAARHGSASDTHEHAQLSDYGRLWCLSRQALINDDLNWFQRVPQRMSATSRRSLNGRVYTYLFGANFAGPAILEDGTTVFTAAHANLAALGAGAAVSDTTVNVGWNAMATQALPSPDGGRSAAMYGNFRPRFLLHGPFNTMNVNRVLASEYLTEAGETGAVVGSSVVNVFGPRGTRNGVVPVEEALLDFLVPAVATRPWYLAADPNITGTVTVYYLNGKETPTVSREDARISEPDGVTWKIMHTYAIAAEDFRGLYCNAGR